MQLFAACMTPYVPSLRITSPRPLDKRTCYSKRIQGQTASSPPTQAHDNPWIARPCGDFNPEQIAALALASSHSVGRLRRWQLHVPGDQSRNVRYWEPTCAAQTTNRSGDFMQPVDIRQLTNRFPEPFGRHCHSNVCRYAANCVQARLFDRNNPLACVRYMCTTVWTTVLWSASK